MEIKRLIQGWLPFPRLQAAFAFAMVGLFALSWSQHASSNEEASLKIKLNGVCPLNAGKEKETGLTYEMAKHPRLTFEMVEQVSPWEDSIYAGLAPVRKPKDLTPKSELLKGLDLEQESLFSAEFQKSISFPQPTALGANSRVNVYVCDDANENGRCSDEPEERQIAIKQLQYRADRLPESLAILVRAGCQ